MTPKATPQTQGKEQQKVEGFIEKKPSKVTPQNNDCTFKHPWDKQVDEVAAQLTNGGVLTTVQREVINAVMWRKDIIALMPTGSGKSLCYQLPAVVLNGVSLVISPLNALILDQAIYLRSKGILCGVLQNDDSKETWDPPDLEKQLMGKRGPAVLYCTPEKISMSGKTKHLIETLAGLGKIIMVAVDEAHCITIWGKEFRSAYRELSIIKTLIPGVLIAAFTASATLNTIQDISETLKLLNPVTIKAKLFREGLKMGALYTSDKGGYGMDRSRIISSAIRQLSRGEQCIVYVTFKRQAESVAKNLREMGISCQPYHSGMSATNKAKNMKEWMEWNGSVGIQVIVATVAFGMGVNCPTVRLVISYGFPSGLESLYQLAGRAGRDGRGGEFILIWGDEDRAEELSIFLPEKLDGPFAFAVEGKCRWRTVLESFDEEVCGPCGCCDVCLGGYIKQINITPLVRIACRIVEQYPDSTISSVTSMITSGTYPCDCLLEKYDAALILLNNPITKNVLINCLRKYNIISESKSTKYSGVWKTKLNKPYDYVYEKTYMENIWVGSHRWYDNFTLIEKK